MLQSVVTRVEMDRKTSIVEKSRSETLWIIVRQYIQYNDQGSVGIEEPENNIKTKCERNLKWVKNKFSVPPKLGMWK